MNELWFLEAAENPRTNGFHRILATEPVHPYIPAWWPPGHGLGYDHTFTNEIADFARAVLDGTDPEPSFAYGLQVQRVLAAVEDSSVNQARWTQWPPIRRALASDGSKTRSERRKMQRPITLFTGQWADLPFVEVCKLAEGWGYDGLEIACWGDHLTSTRL